MNREQPVAISVVIPVYNRRDTLGYCLRSVLSQSYQPLEIILVDDGSTDGSLEIAREFEDPRIVCIALAGNSGAQAARNRGVAEAKGEWIAFQDSDDEWGADRLARAVEELQKYQFDPLTVIHSDCWRYDHQRESKEEWQLPLTTGETAYAKLLTTPGPMFQGMLVSRHALQLIGGLDHSLPAYQEWDTSIRLARVCRMVHLRENLFTYHLHLGETISKDSFKGMKGYWQIIRKNRGEIIRVQGVRRFLALALSTALQAARGRHYRLALRIVKESVA